MNRELLIASKQNQRWRYCRHIFNQTFAAVQEIKVFLMQPHATPHTQHDSLHMVASGDANPQATHPHMVASGDANPQATHLIQPDLQHHTPPPVQPEQKVCTIVAQLADTYHWTHNVAVEEPPGYILLGILLVYFGKMLSCTSNDTYKCHPQRTVAKNTPGQNPSTDVALILRKRDDDTAEYISKVLYEYKPQIHHTIQLTNISHLLELFLQCYYVMKYEKQYRILGCLTDLIVWHYFALQLSIVGRLEIVQYTKLEMTLPPQETEVSQHLAMLTAYLQPTVGM